MKTLRTSLLCLGLLGAVPAWGASWSSIVIDDLALDVTGDAGAEGLRFNSFGFHDSSFSWVTPPRDSHLPSRNSNLSFIRLTGGHPSGSDSVSLEDPLGAASTSLEVVGSGGLNLPDRIALASRAEAALGAGSHNGAGSSISLFDGPPLSLFELAPHTTLTLSGTATYATHADPTQPGVAVADLNVFGGLRPDGSDPEEFHLNVLSPGNVASSDRQGEQAWRIVLSNTTGAWTDGWFSFQIDSIVGSDPLPVPEADPGATLGLGDLALALWLRRRGGPRKAPLAGKGA